MRKVIFTQLGWMNSHLVVLLQLCNNNFWVMGFQALFYQCWFQKTNGTIEMLWNNKEILTSTITVFHNLHKTTSPNCVCLQFHCMYIQKLKFSTNSLMNLSFNLPTKSTWMVDTVGSSQIYFPTQNLELDKESEAVLWSLQYNQWSLWSF